MRIAGLLGHGSKPVVLWIAFKREPQGRDAGLQRTALRRHAPSEVRGPPAFADRIDFPRPLASVTSGRAAILTARRIQHATSHTNRWQLLVMGWYLPVVMRVRGPKIPLENVPDNRKLLIEGACHPPIGPFNTLKLFLDDAYVG